MHAQGYRLAYTIIALLTTAIWLGFVRQLPDAELYRIDGLPRLLLIALQAVGGAFALAALLPIDGLAFLGLRPFPNGDEPFAERGIYRYCRHPMYFGIVLILLAMPQQSVNSLNLALVVTLYFAIGSRLEERRMERAHPEYADYRRRVPAFVPNIRRSTL